MTVRNTVLAFALVCAACGSDRPKDVAYPAPPGFQGFPRSSSDEGVYAEASFDSRSKDVFGFDLVEHGVVPVHLKIQLRGESMNTKLIRLDQDRWDMRLYLQDGTVVPAVSAEKVAEGLRSDDARRVRDNAFQPTLLGEQATQGYVFFWLTPESRFKTDGSTVYHALEGGYRPLHLPDSLVAFNVSIEDAVRPFYVGVH